MIRTLGPRWVLAASLSAIVCLQVASGSDEDKREIRKMLERGLVLSCGPESKSDRFQFEVRTRLINENGSIVEQRSVIERLQQQVGVLLVSPGGFPSSLVLNHAFWVVDRDELRSFQGGHFDCRAGITSKGAPGIEITYAGNLASESTVALDLGALVQYFMVDNSEFASDQRAGKYWITTPKGARLCLYMARPSEVGSFPVRAVAIGGSGPGGSGRLEMTISNICAGTAPPRSILRFAVDPMSGVVEVPFAQIKNSHFNDLGLSFDDNDESTRATSRAMLRKFEVQDQLRMPLEIIQQVQWALSKLENAVDLQVQEALQCLRTIGTAHVWGRLERECETTQPCFRVSYDRFKAAQLTEIALGPESASLLRAKLARIVTTPRYTTELRCDALDLLGQFGLPVQSPLLSEIKASVASQPNPELDAILASVVVRLSSAESADLNCLHQVIKDNRLSPSTITQSIEALAIVDELGEHLGDLDALCGREVSDTNKIPRRVRALAATAEGRSTLLKMLEQGSNQLAISNGLIAVSETLKPGDSEWKRLQQICRNIALNATHPVDERVAANRVVHRDAEALASKYTDEFLRSVIDTNDMDLLYGALWNLVEIGKSAACFDILQVKLDDPDAAKRVNFATLTLAVATLELHHRQQLPRSFWANLDRIVGDNDPSVRRLSAIIVLSLLDRDIRISPAYVSRLVDAAVKAQAPEHLCLFCAALRRLTGSDCTPALPEDVKSYDEVVQWHQQNAAQVRKHLHGWYEKWQREQGDSRKNRVE